MNFILILFDTTQLEKIELNNGKIFAIFPSISQMSHEVPSYSFIR